MNKIPKDLQRVKGEDALSEYSDDTLAGMADELAKEAERLGRLARGAHAELQARMRDRNATKLDTPNWAGKMTPGLITHTVDDMPLFRSRLATLLSKDQIDAAFVQPPLPSIWVDHRILNEFRKQGGVVATVIAEFRQSVRGEDRLVLTRKPEA